MSKLKKGGSKPYTIVHKKVCSYMIHKGGEKMVPSLCMHAYTTNGGDHSIKFRFFSKRKENMEILPEGDTFKVLVKTF